MQPPAPPAKDTLRITESVPEHFWTLLISLLKQVLLVLDESFELFDKDLFYIGPTN